MYLSEVQTTRYIKKKVLTGDETVELYQYAISNGVRINNILPNVQRRGEGYCNIYPVKTVPGTSHCVWIGSGGGDNNVYFISILTDMNMSTTDEFKQYLADQYAAGTPVTVWYVLATPTTGTLNEPIRKIGDYSDSVTGTGIPTTGTAEQFDVDTTLKPSEVSLTYHGWHEHQDTVFTTE